MNSLEKVTKVYCNHCGKFLYEYTGFSNSEERKALAEKASENIIHFDDHDYCGLGCYWSSLKEKCNEY